MAYTITHDDGTVEVFASKTEVEWGVCVPRGAWADVDEGLPVQIDSFLGPVVLRKGN